METACRKSTIHVLPRPYQAWIENGLLTRAGSVLSELLPQASRIFVVTVPPVRKRWGSKLVSSLKASGFTPQVIPMPDGEPTKRLATVEALADKLARSGPTARPSSSRWAEESWATSADCWPRSICAAIEFVQIPTTVLAQVDASIGGKTGVNLVAGKNMVGTFHHPRVVLIDPTVLKTLPDREFRAGLYEALKCGIIGNVELFLRFEQNRARILKRDPVELEWLIAQSVRLKAEVVSADEREGRSAPRSQPGPHHWPRARGRNRLPPPAARRSRCLGHDRRHQHRAQRGPHRQRDRGPHRRRRVEPGPPCRK